MKVEAELRQLEPRWELWKPVGSSQGLEVSLRQASLNQGSVFQEYDTDCEVFRQRFRQFQYKEAAGPHEAFNKLWELCCQWLKPKMRSKEQILELLVLEQFLTILPTEIETWVREHCPENRERVVSLIEDLQRELEIPEQQVRKEVGILVIRPKEVARQLGLDQTF